MCLPVIDGPPLNLPPSPPQKRLADGGFVDGLFLPLLHPPDGEALRPIHTRRPARSLLVVGWAPVGTHYLPVVPVHGPDEPAQTLAHIHVDSLPQQLTLGAAGGVPDGPAVYPYYLTGNYRCTPFALIRPCTPFAWPASAHRNGRG